MGYLTHSAAWKALESHAMELDGVSLAQLFAEQSDRFSRYTLEACGILFDYSKNRVTDRTIQLLMDLLQQQELPQWRERMFRGDPVNFTEQRAVLHTALRGSCPDLTAETAQINSVLARMETFAEQVRSGQWLGYTGKAVRDIVHIGIGGSSLGPRLVCEALRPFHLHGLSVHFVSNIDGSHLFDLLETLDAETTLFIVASKTFTTQETLCNAHSARKWLIDNLGDEAAVACHFVAVSTNSARVAEFGIDPENCFGFWDWVGGRFSLWSAVGLPVMLMVGREHFRQLLAGASEMDEHFRSAEPQRNMPILLAMIGIWHTNFCGFSNHAVLPYDQHLASLPEYLQQLEMESNGKRVNRNGEVVDYQTAPILWGTAGTDGQHAFYQLIHQGTRKVSSDFIVAANGIKEQGEHHRKLLANCLAQSEALMLGRNSEQTAASLGITRETELAHRVFPGNQPSSTLLLDRLTPQRLGALLALYEHKVFVQGVIWEINSFDQWGVELGKQLADRLFAELRSGQPDEGHDSSTRGLMKRLLELRARKI